MQVESGELIQRRGTVWRVSSFWAHEDEEYTKCDENGNHTAIDKGDVPDLRTQMQAEIDYLLHVEETADDPLDRAVPRKRYLRTEVWEGMFFVDTDDGLHLSGARKKSVTVTFGDETISTESIEHPTKFLPKDELSGDVMAWFDPAFEGTDRVRLSEVREQGHIIAETDTVVVVSSASDAGTPGYPIQHAWFTDEQVKAEARRRLGLIRDYLPEAQPSQDGDQ